MKNKITLMLALILAGITTNNSFAQLVTSGADDGSDGTLRQEILDTPPGGEITFSSTLDVVLTMGELIIDKELTITGPVSIDANNTSRIFNVTNGPLVLNNVLLTNGEADNGGAIYTTSLVTINNSEITDNIANGTSGSGGGIFIGVNGGLIVNNTTISSNLANRAGGGIEDQSGVGLGVTLNNVNLNNNNAGAPPTVAAPGNGGGLHITGPGDAIISGGTVTGNLAGSEGGGLWNGSGTMTVDGVMINDNDAQGEAADNGGGGIFNNGGVLVVQNGTTIMNNIASGTLGSGGGIFTLTPGTISVDGITISNNSANRAGGGIEISSASGETYAFNNVILDGNTISSPAPGNGGGLHISGPGNVNYNWGSVVNNTAFEGGGLWNGSGTMIITGTMFTNNTANGDTTGGGALFNNGGTLVIDASTSISANSAIGNTPGGRGGAIFNNTGGMLTIASGLTISGNYASRAGGAIEDNSGGILNLNGIILTGNSAGVDIGLGTIANPGNGGAIHLSGTTSATLNNCTITSNIAASEGGGLWNNLGTMTVNNTLVDSNEAKGDAADNGGAGIFNNGGTLVVENATVTNNIATGASGSGGGVFSTGGEVTISDSEILMNIANRAGGGIELIEGILNSNNNTVNSNITGNAPGNGGGLHITGAADSNITGGTFNNNVAAREGGGLWNGTGTMTVDAVNIDGNTASGPATDDGGAGIFNNGGELVVQNATIISNNVADGTSGSGGGILTIGGDVTVDGSSIILNQANRAGGGIELAGGTLNLINLTLDMNNAGVSPAVAAPGSGGGLHVSGSANTNITGGTTNGNIATNEGGGLWNGSGVMTIVDHTIDGNTASGNDIVTAGAAGGGGIYNEGGILDVSGATAITNNVADGAQSTGGGILNAAGTLMADGISIMNNTSNRAGGGIETNGGGTVILNNVSLNSNDTGIVTGTGAPGNGGGLHVSGNSPVTVIGGTVNMNTAASEGGGLWNGMGVLTVDGATIDSNIASGATASEGGGGIYALTNGTVNLINGTTVSNNIADGASGSGGGILVDADASFSATDSFITGNQANRAGGGIEVVAGAGTASLFNTALDNNNAGVSPAVAAPGNGGGLHITGMQDFTITGGTVNGNLAGREGAGLWNGTGVMLVDGVTIDANTAFGSAANQGGAGIFNNGGTLDVVNGSMISNNLSTGASASGGGLLSTAGEVTISDSTFDSNAANRAGGAIEIIDGILTFSNSIMIGNDVNGTAGTAAPGNGGGLHITGTSGTVSIDTSTISGNTAANEGGGLWNQNGTVMNVSMSTIDNNISGEGGGIFNNTGAITNVVTSTISGNTASISGGGLSNNGAVLDLNAVTIVMNTTSGIGGGIDAVNNITIKNSIVALNTAASGMDVSGTLTSNDYNIIGTDDLSIFTSQANDVEEVDPLVGPLQDNGGTTLTHQLLDNSPAFDAADPTDTFVDQIGQSVYGVSRDIGAYESQITLLSVDDFNQIAVVSIYPNPSNGAFNIVLKNANSRDVNVEIHAITGALVKKMKLNYGLNTVNIKGFASGIYIVNIKTESSNSSHKIVMQ
ncbi:choice-of-anchor Q domain-containing protein [Lacinutrix cladophorae]